MNQFENRAGSRPHDRIFLFAAATFLVVAAVITAIEHYWLRDLKFDDAWIHLRYSRNLAEGKGFVFNEGERVLGSAGMLWNLLIAAIALVIPVKWLPGAVSLLNYVLLLAGVLFFAAALRDVP